MPRRSQQQRRRKLPKQHNPIQHPGGVNPIGSAIFIAFLPVFPPCMRLLPSSRSASLVPPDGHTPAPLEVKLILVLSAINIESSQNHFGKFLCDQCLSQLIDKRNEPTIRRSGFQSPDHLVRIV